MEIYGDGGYSLAKGIGGWGFVCVEDDEAGYKQWGVQRNTTVNRMELTALLTAMSEIQEEFTYYTDSSYVVKGYNLWMEEWARYDWKKRDKKLIKNCDLWILVLGMASDRIQVKWIKGHSGNKWNDIADGLSKSY